jgi:ribosomal-protein-alanine acetyltransferase
VRHNFLSQCSRLQIRPATRSDLPAIETIQRSSPEASAWMPLDYTCDVAVVEDGQVVAFLVTRKTAPDESEVLNLAVHPAFRGRGIGRQLLAAAIQAAPGTWFLEVRESNAPALALYRSLGFHTTGRRENYYKNPSEAAIVMRIHS